MRRLLMGVATAALFTGAIPNAPPRGGVISLTTAPDGGWTHVNDPHAIHHDGVTYFGFIDGDDGHVKVGAFDHATETTSLFTLGTAPEVDTHDAPTIHVRDSDQRIMVWWSGHLGPSLFQRVSTNPLDISAFGAATNLDSQLGGDAYTYPVVYQLDDGTLHLFIRDHEGVVHPGRLYHSTSTNGGTTWAALTLLVEEPDRTPYFVISSNDADRIDIAISNGHPGTDDPVSVHHLWTDGTDWSAADGTDLGAPPFTASDLPMVYDGSDGPAWPTSIIMTPEGAAFTFEVFDDPDSNSYRRAKWTGAWVLWTVVDSGDTVESGVAPHACMDPEDPDVVYASVKVGSRYEIRRYRPGSMTPVTDGSAVDHIFPEPIHRAPTDRRILWLRGTYTTYLDTSLGVMAGR